MLWILSTVNGGQRAALAWAAAGPQHCISRLERARGGPESILTFLAGQPGSLASHSAGVLTQEIE